MSISETSNSVEGIAIIGMSGRFPDADDVNQFWKNLCFGVESISAFTDAELIASGIEPELLSNPKYVKSIAVLENVDLFDASFFAFNPKEAEITDPQHRLFLECAWEALENAGYDCQRCESRIGVYAGASSNNYLSLDSNSDSAGLASIFQKGIGNDNDFLATRVSYKLNLTGPSLTVQTACSTSLVATSLACQSLLNYQCDMALAGGVSINILQKTGYLYQEGGILSPDGHCRAFDAKARGTIIGNGLGIVVLKRLADAIADGDHIYAVIKGSAINNDGSDKVGYTAPSVNGQSQVIAEALALADVEPETISYIEAHGTGTVLGDPIEISALTNVFRESTVKKGFCAIGSVKTNIGHLDAAAGVTSLIKTVLALKHQQIPPSLNFAEPNPEIDFANSPFYVNTKLTEWKTIHTPRRAGVSSLGIGGTNAHVILEEAPILPESSPSRPWQLLVLSAKTESALETITKNLAQHLLSHPKQNLADIAYTLQVGRAEFNHRRVVMCRDIEDAASSLQLQNPRKIFTHSVETTGSSIVFMFPGQGTQYVNMGKELYQTEPIFQEQVDLCCQLLQPHLGMDLRTVIFPNEYDSKAAAEKLQQTAITQPALFVIEYALAKLWMSWGISPSAMVGHSIGEYVAACLAQVLSLADALALLVIRGRLMQQLPSGAMLSVSQTEAEIKTLLNENLSLAASNAPDLCVVSGTHDAVETIHQQLIELGIECRRLHTSHAFHSVMMEPLIERFIKEVKKVKLNPPQIPFISNVTGSWITSEQATNPNYWAKHLRQTVQFTAGISTLLQEPNRILLEVGPGRSLCTFVKKYSDLPGFCSLRHPQEKQSDLAFLINTLGKLWLYGVQIDWAGFYAYERRHRIPLPTYPFERQRYWIEPQEQANYSRINQASSEEKLDVTNWFNIPSWKRSAPLVSIAQEKFMQQGHCWLVFIDTCNIGNQIVERLKGEHQNIITVKIGDQFSKIGDWAYTINPRSRDDYDTLFKNIRDSGAVLNRIIHLWNITLYNNETSRLDYFEATQDISFWSLLFLTQALGEQNLTSSVEISIVSNNLQQVLDEEYLCPEKAPILGLCKVIPQEYSHIFCRSIDITLPQVETKQWQQLIDNLFIELATSTSDQVIAYRGNKRWVQCFEPLAIERQAVSTNKLREGGVYVITGGLGGIGLAIAEHLAKTVQAKLVLIGRSELPPSSEWEELLFSQDKDDLLKTKIKKVQLLEELGAEVLVLTADVANLEQMQSAINQVHDRFGKIHGVIHAAGAPGAGLIQLKTPELAAKVFQPKLKGTLVLDAVLQDINLDFLVLFSSNTAITGGIGQVDYCAVNAFLDAFAHYNFYQQQIPTVSINWDWWQGNNWADSLMSTIPGLQAEFKKMREKYAISFTEGVDAFSRILSIKQPQVVVSTQSLATVIEGVNGFATFISPTEASTSNLSLGKHPRPLLETAYVEPSNVVEQKIADIWQELLGLEKVGVDDNFFDLGGHSLIATQMVSQLRQDFQVELSLRRIFEAPTVAELALVLEDILIKELEELTEDEAGQLVSNI